MISWPCFFLCFIQKCNTVEQWKHGKLENSINGEERDKCINKYNFMYCIFLSYSDGSIFPHHWGDTLIIVLGLDRIHLQAPPAPPPPPSQEAHIQTVSDYKITDNFAAALHLIHSQHNRHRLPLGKVTQSVQSRHSCPLLNKHKRFSVCLHQIMRNTESRGTEHCLATL